MEADPLGFSLVHCFGQANPSGPGQGDVPALLRRVADTLEGIPGADVFELVLHHEINEYGMQYNITVTYALPSSDEGVGHIAGSRLDLRRR